MLTQRKKSKVLTNIIQTITEQDRADLRSRLFLAARIDDLRREKGLTLSDLAEKLNIVEEEMSEIIAGNKELPMDLEALQHREKDFYLWSWKLWHSF